MLTFHPFPASPIRSRAWIGAWLLIVPATTQAQITLQDAIREADRNAFTNRVATATTQADQARARMPLKGILPSARIETGVARTTDPIGAFGTTLRQRRVSPAAFDPARLNYPDAITNVQSGVVVEVPLLNGDAWTGWQAARAAAEASEAAGDWAGVTTRALVVRAYYGAILAGEKVAVLEQSQRAAEANLRQIQAMVQQGLVTKADALQASVHVADVTAQRLTGALDAQTAREQLGLLLGRRDGSVPVVPTNLPGTEAVRAIATQDTSLAGQAQGDPGGASNAPSAASGPALRADVRAAALAVSVARAERRRAASTLLPRVNSFARYDWNDPSGIYGGQKNWTVGVTASWSIFGGGSELADIAAASARLATARAGEDAARAQEQLDGNSARRALAVSLQRLDLARESASASQEALRLVEKRYAGGLVTVAELLSAQTQTTAAALSQSAARYAVIDALATYRRATGGDPATLVSLEAAR